MRVGLHTTPPDQDVAQSSIELLTAASTGTIFDVQFVSSFYVATGRMGEARGTMTVEMKSAIATDESSAL